MPAPKEIGKIDARRHGSLETLARTNSGIKNEIQEFEI
jgi:hypothetical protein